MQLGYSQKGILPLTNPYVITRSDFLKLYPLYQKMALALQQTGKVRIVDDNQPSTVSYASLPSTEPVPPSGGCRYCAPSPAHGGLVAQEGVEGVPHEGAPRDGVLRGATPDGGSIRTPPRGGHQPASLGSYRIKGEKPRGQARIL
jgi:hypothetical protein